MNQPMETNRPEMPDRPKTPYEQRWDAMSDLQKMQLQGLLEYLSNEYLETISDLKKTKQYDDN
jgi:hypothetical protein